MRSCLLLAATVACTSDKTGDSASGAAEPMLTGTVQPEGEPESADFEAYSAVGFDQGGRLLAYVSSNRRADCANITEYLMVGQEPYDPVDVLAGGRCNMWMRIDGYDGALEHSHAEGQDGIDVIGAGVSIECAMGSGEFVLETRDSDDTDYYWSGRWWQGHPLTYSFSFSGGDGDDYVFEIQMSTYDGGFIYEEFDSTPATGEVTGTVDVEWCSSLGSTGLFR